MKILLTFITFSAITFTASGQVFSEQELAAVNTENIEAIEQMKLDSEHVFKGRAGFVTVGTDANNCDYTSIQNAIDDHYSEIRITTNTYSENVLIDDKDVQLLGGYTSCSNANNNIYDAQSMATTIKPVNGSGQPAIQIQTNTRRYVTLRNLTAKNGEYTEPFKGGGLSLFQANLRLTLNTVSLAQNESNNGAGLSVTSGNTNIRAHNLLVVNNKATNNGGGIYCSGGNNSILIDGDEDASAFGIVSNKANNGGGVYITEECQLTSYVGAGKGFDFRGFLNNQATSSGGAISAQSGAKVYLNGNRYCSFIIPYTCYGYNSTPLNLSGNYAIKSGGAIYAEGPGTAVYGNNLKVNLNTAKNGGAVSLLNNALFQTQTTYDNGAAGKASHCWAKGKCNQFTKNSIAGDHGVGVFYVISGSNLKITRTHIEDNHDENQTQPGNRSLFYVSRTDSNLDLEGSYITGNTAANTIDIAIRENASARIVYSTIADNSASSSTVSNNTASVKAYSSIIQGSPNTKALEEYNSIVTETDCLIVNKLGDINDPRSIEADPEFVDRNNNNYHLNAALSPAVDYCDAT